jgi:hypothetical protein
MEQSFKVRELWGRAKPKFMALSSFRKAFVGLSLAGIPTFIAVGWAVQAPNLVTGVTAAIVWFTVAAVDTTLFFWAWEEITELKAAQRRIAMVSLGLLTIALFCRGVHWSMELAMEAARTSEIKDAQEGYSSFQEFKYFHSKQAVCAASSPSLKKMRPDLHLRLVGAQNFDIELVATDALVTDPAYDIFIWDLDNPGVQVLPVKTGYFFHELWIKKGQSSGPYAYMSLPEVSAVVKRGDRLYGFMWGSCPTCVTTRAYWIYAIYGEDGWFAETAKGQYPSLTKTFQNMEWIKKNTEAYLANIPQSARVAIKNNP